MGFTYSLISQLMTNRDIIIKKLLHPGLKNQNSVLQDHRQPVTTGLTVSFVCFILFKSCESIEVLLQLNLGFSAIDQ